MKILELSPLGHVCLIEMEILMLVSAMVCNERERTARALPHIPMCDSGIFGSNINLSVHLRVVWRMKFIAAKCYAPKHTPVLNTVVFQSNTFASCLLIICFTVHSLLFIGYSFF